MNETSTETPAETTAAADRDTGRVTDREAGSPKQLFLLLVASGKIAIRHPPTLVCIGVIYPLRCTPDSLEVSLADVHKQSRPCPLGKVTLLDVDCSCQISCHVWPDREVLLYVFIFATKSPP